MLKRLRCSNFKTLEDFVLELTPAVSVLVGENGSGKSNLGDALLLLSKFARGAAIHDLVTASSRSRWASRWALEFKLDFDENNEELRYELLVAIDPSTGQVRVSAEEAYRDGLAVFEASGGDVTVPTRMHDKPLYHPFPPWQSYLGIAESVKSSERVQFTDETLRALSRLPRLIQNFQVLRLEPARMSGRADASNARLEADGSNFGAWFRHFRLSATQERFDAFLEAASGPLPGLVDLEAVPVGEDVTEVIASFDIRGERCRFSFRELSDGQRQLLCLYLVTASIEAGQVLLLDEPDNFLSLREIQPWLSELESVAQQRGAQVLIASHGAEAMDFLASRQAWFFSRPDGSGTKVRSLVGDGLPSQAILFGLPSESASK
jgi:predicted ATPase